MIVPVPTKPPVIIVTDPALGAPAAGEAPAAATPPAVATPEAKPRVKWRRPRWSHWSYICVEVDRVTLGDTLNQAGNSGWELTSLASLEQDGMACFKRPGAGAQKLP